MSFLQEKCSFGFFTLSNDSIKKIPGSRKKKVKKNIPRGNLAFYERNGFNYLFSTEEQEREFRGLKPECLLNSRLMYFDLIELVR